MVRAGERHVMRPQCTRETTVIVGCYYSMSLVQEMYSYHDISLLPSAFIRKLEPAYTVDKGKRMQLSVEVADPNAQVRWFKNGQEIKPSAK